MSVVYSNPTYQIGALIGIQTGAGIQSANFLYQSGSPRMVSEKAIALDNVGNAGVVAYYNGVCEVSITAIIDSRTTAVPQTGQVVCLYGIQAPTPGSPVSTFFMTGNQADHMLAYVENVSVKSQTREYQTVEFTAWRGLENGIPASATAT